ncbi:MAG: hypothetical protein FK732_10935 [Asgard group archaeon]|nr:hypothetical protein [Asgard group archaeon]
MASSKSKINRPLILLDIGHGNCYLEDTVGELGLISNLTCWGYDLIVLGAGSIETRSAIFTESILLDVDILITTGPFYSENNYTNNEKSLIKTWFDSGNKTIWVSARNDYTSNYPMYHSNALLETINSKLYIESGVIHSETNIAGSNYRPLAVEFNTTHPINLGVNATNGVLCHGSSVVMGYNGTNFVPLEDPQNIPQNVHIIFQANGTGNSSVYEKYKPDEITGYEVHEPGSHVAFVLMAVQEKAGASGTSKIIVSSSAIWSDYKGMFAPPPDYLEEKGYPVENYKVVNNTFHWIALPPPGVGSTTYYEVAFETELLKVTDIITTIEITTETETASIDGFLALTIITPILMLFMHAYRRRRLKTSSN